MKDIDSTGPPNLTCYLSSSLLINQILSYLSQDFSDAKYLCHQKWIFGGERLTGKRQSLCYVKIWSEQLSPALCVFPTWAVLHVKFLENVIKGRDSFPTCISPAVHPKLQKQGTLVRHQRRCQYNHFQYPCYRFFFL